MKPSLLISHLAAAIIITGIVLLIYASVQQAHRSAADDPQLQIARDISYQLSKGKSAGHLLPEDTIDIAQSLAVFTEVFDKNGNPLQTTGYLNGRIPQPPPSVLKFTNENNEDALTWQPQSNVRMAMVFEKIMAPGEGFVAVGRSLKETEIREGNLVKMVGIVWIAYIIVLLIHFLVQSYLLKKNLH
jgi:hypothetical protein